MEGGGPIHNPVRPEVTGTCPSVMDPAATPRILGTADISVSVITARAQTSDTPPAPTREQASPSVPLASMTSLRGSQARRNRANVLAEVDSAPSVSIPTGIRYPHNSKKWQLGVGKCPGESSLEGVFTMGKGEAEIVFKPGQLICPFRGHSQRTRPIHLTIHAWAHNGIPDGSLDCR